MAAGVVSLTDFLQQLREDPKMGSRIRFEAHLEAHREAFGELDPALPEPLRGALGAGGVERLWSHQVAGVEAARAGRDVLVTTPTASGKSMVFQLPVLEAALRQEQGRALFLFPLKALGRDQHAKLNQLVAAAGLDSAVDGAVVYDGDTPTARRTEIRKAPPRVLITNPDMLHVGVLPHWGSWREFLKELRWVVLDELHTYRGIFGSHFHHVLQRLFRLCRECRQTGGSEGEDPSVIASSATAANAGEFARQLTGREFTVIEDSGAPREGRHLMLLRPEASPYTAALELLVACLQADLKTIVFTKARRITELLYSWLRRRDPAMAQRVAGYRAGFLAEERRRIEAELFSGRLDGVISTSALEMGIDVGGLDACILVGYPGSVMATWQRSGRVGRAARESLTALVALPDALDQYFLDHPDDLLGRPCERLLTDPTNDPVRRAHLVCAAAEKGLSKERDAVYLERHQPAVEALLESRDLLASAGGDEYFSPRRRPQRGVNLRGTGAPYTIRALSSNSSNGGNGSAGPDGSEKGRVIGTVDGVRALHECHPGAVYLHAGRQYLVTELDAEKREARARREDLEYFTTPLTEKETQILEVLEERHDGPLHAWVGRLKVTERVIGYERKRIRDQESLGQHGLDLPPVSFETVGLWWSAGAALEETLRRGGEHFMGSLHAGEHAAIALLPTLALCDRGDIGGISQPFHPQVGTGAVFLYDGHSGGVGITAGAFRDLPDLLDKVEALVAGCECETGCPSCIQSPKCGNGNRPLDKGGAARLLRLLLGREEPVVPLEETPPSITLAMPDDGDDGDDGGASVEAVEGGASVEAVEAVEAEKPARPRPRTRRPSNSRRIPPRAAAPSPRSPRSAPDALPGNLPNNQPNTVLFDLETRRSAADVGGWHNIHRMGLALGVLCFLEEGRFETFFEDQVRELVAALRSATLVVGFNSKGFDYRVLNGYTGEDYSRSLPSLDLLEDLRRRLGFRLSLDHLARETLGEQKSADGLQSLEWVKEGRLDLVEEYCRHDVEILRDLYLFGRREGFVRYRPKDSDSAVLLPVDW